MVMASETNDGYAVDVQCVCESHEKAAEILAKDIEDGQIMSGFISKIAFYSDTDPA